MNHLNLRLTFVFIFYFLNIEITADNAYKIIGGNISTIEMHPWMVSIQFLHVHFCGGSIVTDDTIITAAHCFDEVASGITIEAGTADLTKEGVLVRVDTIELHENYVSSTYDYDIAIMKLAEKLVFSDQIQPISIPEVIPDAAVNTPVLASGWGVTKTDDPQTSSILMDVQLYIEDWATCKDKLADDQEVTDRMLCAGDQNGGRDTCQADSGGALELNGTLIGIVSWGHSCGEADYPGVYTHVGRFRSWIKQHAGI